MRDVLGRPDIFEAPGIVFEREGSIIRVNNGVTMK